MLLVGATNPMAKQVPESAVLNPTEVIKVPLPAVISFPYCMRLIIRRNSVSQVESLTLLIYLFKLVLYQIEPYS